MSTADDAVSKMISEARVPEVKFTEEFLSEVPFMRDTRITDFIETPDGPAIKIMYPSGKYAWFAAEGTAESGIGGVKFAISRPPRRATHDAGGALAVPAETLQDVALSRPNEYG